MGLTHEISHVFCIVFSAHFLFLWVKEMVAVIVFMICTLHVITSAHRSRDFGLLLSKKDLIDWGH